MFSICFLCTFTYLTGVSVFYYLCEFCNRYFKIYLFFTGARGSVVGRDTMLQAGRSRFRVSMRWNFNCTVALGST
jgi:hypothetical protein